MKPNKSLTPALWAFVAAICLFPGLQAVLAGRPSAGTEEVLPAGTTFHSTVKASVVVAPNTSGATVQLRAPIMFRGQSFAGTFTAKVHEVSPNGQIALEVVAFQINPKTTLPMDQVVKLSARSMPKLTGTASVPAPELKSLVIDAGTKVDIVLTEPLAIH